jgi:HAD superfamily hydrolase (TIGR01549 family)
MVLPKDIKLLIFDLDGTLYDLKINWAVLKDQLAQLAGKNVAPMQIMLDGLSDADSEKAAKLLRDAEIEGVKSGAPLHDARAVLAKLCDSYTIALLTRNSVDAATLALERLGVKEDVYIVGRESITRNKPHPDGLHVILDQFELSPAQAVMIGDTSHDVEAAKAAGMFSIIITNDSLAYQPKGADAYIDTLRDLL